MVKYVSRASSWCGLVLLATGIFLGGCSNAPTCDEPGFYESAQLGKRIEPPEDLDALEAWTAKLSAALPKDSGDRATNGNGGSYVAEFDRGDGEGEGVR